MRLLGGTGDLQVLTFALCHDTAKDARKPGIESFCPGGVGAVAEDEELEARTGWGNDELPITQYSYDLS